MRALSVCFLLSLTIAAMLQAGDVHARSSMSELVVSEKDGKPCFALKPDRETRRYRSRIAYVNVASDPSPGSTEPARVAWASTLPPAPGEYTLGAEECLAYGQRVPGEEIVTAAQPLQPGVRYTVTMNTFLRGKGGSTNSGYAGQFCLARDRQGRVRVHDLWHAPRAGVAAGDACRPFFRQP
ncbi:hypothetical protein [Stenotrophomonas sp. MMGLT7]|uniref:hypothetical protein n=1 Tax=Stenotrophomonas sp. MMGLT7 TaxID=2901227 RepID=UPI001E328ADB|nr:hypothetical protein [Stenotrophomonas sp. MMGLT7]MCD7099067.1 hypothetical protein [Stenotrophomonas sp. MMGLT7]